MSIINKKSILAVVVVCSVGLAFVLNSRKANKSAESITATKKINTTEKLSKDKITKGLSVTEDKPTAKNSGLNQPDPKQNNTAKPNTYSSNSVIDPEAKRQLLSSQKVFGP